MNLGDLVVVIDPSSPRLGTWGTFVNATPNGRLLVRFPDGVETLDPFQVENDARLAAVALAKHVTKAHERPLAAAELQGELELQVPAEQDRKVALLEPGARP